MIDDEPEAAEDAESTSAPSALTTPVSPTTVASDDPVAVSLSADFPIEFYQGEASFPGHGGNFSGLFDGTRPVVLNLWAGACPPCRAEMPDLDDFNTEYSDRVALFGLERVDADDGVESAVGDPGQSVRVDDDAVRCGS